MRPALALAVQCPATMKKQGRDGKRKGLLLTTEKVRELVQVPDDRLRDVAGGESVATTSTFTTSKNQ